MALCHIGFLLLTIHGFGAAGHSYASETRAVGNLRAAVESHEWSEEVETSSLQNRWSQMRSDAMHAMESHLPLPPRLIQVIDTEQQVQQPQESPIIQLVRIIVNLIIMSVVAFLYLQWRYVPQGKLEADASQPAADLEGDWEHHCCSFFQEPGTFCCACCCMPLRWAETISLVKGLLPFWSGFALFALLFHFQFFQAFSPVPWLCLAILGAAYRQELRRKFGFKNVGGCTYVTDCLMYSFCCLCAVVQEARHVEDALASGKFPDVVASPEGRVTSSVRKHCLTCHPFGGSESPEYE